MQSAAKVGALVIAFLVLLGAAFALLGRSLWSEKTERYYADFENVGGIARGARVLLSGVEIGSIEAITLVAPQQARLTLRIKESVRLPEGSVAMIEGSLISLGENPVQIVPGGGPSNLPPEAILPGRMQGPLEALLPDLGGTLGELNKTLAAARGFIEDEAFKARIEELIATSERTLKAFGEVGQQTSGLIAENRVAVHHAVREAALAMTEVRKSAELAHAMLADGEFKDESLNLLRSLTGTTVKAQDLLVSLDRFVNDPNLKESLGHVNTMSETGTRIALNAEEITQNGVVVSEKAIELTDKAMEIADEAKKVMTQLQGLLGGSRGGRSFGPIGAEMALFRESEPGRWRTDAEFQFPLSGSESLHFGIYDAFETNKVNLQLGRSLGGGARYRYGMYASKPGFGVDFRVANRLTLRGDLFDLNEPRLNFKAGYEFGNGLVGWLGIERVFDDPIPVIGVGIRR